MAVFDVDEVKPCVGGEHAGPDVNVDQFVEQQGMEWVILMAERHHLYSLRATSGVPTTIFLNRDGNEVTRFVGGRPYHVFKQAFQAIL